jgi:hypothetical protein
MLASRMPLPVGLIEPPLLLARFKRHKARQL